jgi:hypothetical protein
LEHGAAVSVARGDLNRFAREGDDEGAAWRASVTLRNVAEAERISGTPAGNLPGFE